MEVMLICVRPAGGLVFLAEGGASAWDMLCRVVGGGRVQSKWSAGSA